jgi:colanic acid biosynthesis glycosyl transferase WcaI
MRILIHDFGGYPFCLELSREIARRGHDVQHVFFPGACESMRNMEPHADDPSTFEIVPVGDGLPYSKYSLFRRRFQEIAVGKHLARHIEQWRPDIVVSANAPLDVQKQAISAAKKAGARFVFWLQDLISVAMEEILERRLGVLGGIVARHYRKVEQDAARGSDAIVCISEDFLPLLRQWGIAGQHCTVIENWAPKDHIRPLPKDNPWSRAHDLHRKTVFLYSGRLGLKHNPQLMLDLALAHRDRTDIAVVVVAEGLGADWLARRKAETGLTNLLLLPFQPYADLPHVLAAADVLVCIIEAGASRYSVPSKILSYLCAGRAVLAAMPKENLNARHIARIGAGMVVDPDRPETMLAAARTFCEDPAFRDECANRARAYAEEAFDIGKITDRFMAVLTGT